jgi:methionyl-tRNA synthetase
VTKGKFYITTAIDYVNASPHIGTAYEKIAADFLARARRLFGDDVRFVMGNDEHSVNVAARREARPVADRLLRPDGGQVPRRLGTARHLVRRLHSHHRSRATCAPCRRCSPPCTPPATSTRAATRAFYCDSCEAFYQEKDLSTAAARSTRPSRAGSRRRNYFFSLSRFGDPPPQHIRTHPEFVQPEARRNEVLKVVEGGLEDISVSRSGSRVGIPLPLDFRTSFTCGSTRSSTTSRRSAGRTIRPGSCSATGRLTCTSSARTSRASTA